MRKQLLNLKFLLMLCMIFFIGGGSLALAGEVTLTTADYDWKAVNNKVTQVVSGVTFDFNGGTTAPTYYDDGLRTYEGCVITISSESKITKIDFTYTINNSGSLTLNGSNGTWNGTSKSWAGSSNSVALKVGHSSGSKNGQVRITKIVVTTESTSPTISTSAASLNFGQVETGTSKELSFTLNGENLTADANLSITGDNAEMFSLSKASISPATDGTISEVVTVTYSPTTEANHTASLSVTSEGATTATVNLNGSGVKRCSVSWMVNGMAYTDGTPTTDVLRGNKVTTLPTTPEAINGKVFVGWTDAPIATSQDDAPSILFTTAVESPIVTDNTTYYAVFAKQDGGISSEELTGAEILNLGKLAYYTEKTYSGSSLSYVIHGYKTNETCPWIQLKSSMDSYIKITAPQNITKVGLTITGAGNSTGGLTDISKHDPFEETVGLVTSDCNFNATSENIGSTSEISNNEATINTTNGSNAKEVYIKVSKGARIWGITTYYGSVQYSGYTTTVSEPATPVTGTLTLVAKDKDFYYATFSSDKDVLFPTDVEVDAVSVTGNTMHITDMESTKGTYNVKTDVEGSSASVENLYYVPANTGVLIQSLTNSVTYYYPYSPGTVTITETNQLKPAPAGGTFAAEKGHVYYKLAYNDYNEKTGLGFYWGAADGGAFSVKANTAYLDVTATGETSAKGFSFDGTTTDISSVATEGKAKEIFNIAGQRVNAMTKAGLYIVNGKKMVIKK